MPPARCVLLCRLAAIRKALGRYGKLLEDGTRKAADTTGNIWNHRTYRSPCTQTLSFLASIRVARTSDTLFPFRCWY